uniref:Uncharacterized protein n=1 Tax=Anguilla anguilla TaxID=7936 RepID=A0A0E9XQH9_ANGAN
MHSCKRNNRDNCKEHVLFLIHFILQDLGNTNKRQENDSIINPVRKVADVYINIKSVSVM